jgi:PAS domain S-box-containing protein
MPSPSSDQPAISWRLPAIPWHRRLHVHVALGISLLVACSLGAVLLSATSVVESRSMSLASNTLEAARTAFYHLAESQAESAAAQARLITTLPVFRAYMTDTRLAGDAASLDAMTEEYRRRLRAQFCILTDRTGRWTATPGWRAAAAVPPAMRSSIDSAVNGSSHHDIVAVDAVLFLIVSEPASFAEETLGTLTFGYALDDTVARELSDVTHAEVNLVAGDNLSGSSLPAAERAQMAAQLSDHRSERGRGVSLTVERLSTSEYVTGTYPLVRDRGSDGTGHLVLLQDWRPTRLFLAELRYQFLRSGLIICALAVSAGFVFSGRISRPLTDIAAAAGEMALGNRARRVPIRGSAEATTMASAFNAMATSLQHSYENAQDNAERLLASNERFQSVTESARDAIVSTNGQGAITFWNRSAGDIFGYSEREAVGGALTTFIAGPDRQRYLDAISSPGFEDGRPIVGRTIEVTAIRKDGTEFTAEISLSAAHSSGATSVTAVARDISERKQAEALLRRHDEEVQAQRLHIFRATMTTVHDIVNNFLGSMQLIRMDAEGRLSEETLTLFDSLIRETASDLKVLGDLEIVREKPMVVGTGIEFPRAHAI